jgi:hypothetical protein
MQHLRNSARRWRAPPPVPVLGPALVPLLLALTLFVNVGAAQAPRAVWVVPIDTQITSATVQFVETRLERAGAEQPLAVVFEIDTPGGSVVAAEEIANAILNAPVPTIAVANQALSAGALVAMSAEQLAMLPGGTIGAHGDERARAEGLVSDRDRRYRRVQDGVGDLLGSHHAAPRRVDLEHYRQGLFGGGALEARGDKLRGRRGDLRVDRHHPDGARGLSPPQAREKRQDDEHGEP